MLLTGEERAVLAEARAEKAERSQREAVSRLSNMRLTPEQIAEALNLSLEEVKAIAAEI